jgi:hypothetical protein
MDFTDVTDLADKSLKKKDLGKSERRTPNYSVKSVTSVQPPQQPQNRRLLGTPVKSVSCFDLSVGTRQCDRQEG